MKLHGDRMKDSARDAICPAMSPKYQECGVGPSAKPQTGLSMGRIVIGPNRDMDVARNAIAT